MQSDLFKQLQHDPLDARNAPDLDMWLEVIGAVNNMIRNSGMSRDQIVDRVNLCLVNSDHTISKNQLNKWLATSQDNCMPAWVIPAICWATRHDSILHALVHPIGRKIVDMRGDMLRQISESQIEAAQKAKEADDLKKALLGVSGEVNG